MSSLTSKDRVPLCLFTFVDGRRCRTPRISSHPHICYYRAQKEARARATEELGKDLAYFFSGDYLSACDLSTALARLIPAVVRGDIKPRLARTVAYMFQTQLQAIHLSQDEIYQRLQHRRLAQSRPQLRQQQQRLSLPARPRTRPGTPTTRTSRPATNPATSPRTGSSSPATPDSCPHPAISHFPHSHFLAPRKFAREPIRCSQRPVIYAQTQPLPIPSHAPCSAAGPTPPPLTPLKATSTHPRATVDSKLLARTLSPLSATLTQNRGDGGHLHLDDMGCCSISGRCAAVVGAQHAVPDLGNQHQIEITRIEAGEELNTHTENYLFGAATVASPSACITASCKAGRTSAIL
jgi:hypothetical protein